MENIVQLWNFVIYIVIEYYREKVWGRDKGIVGFYLGEILRKVCLMIY